MEPESKEKREHMMQIFKFAEDHTHLAEMACAFDESYSQADISQAVEDIEREKGWR